MSEQGNALKVGSIVVDVDEFVSLHSDGLDVLKGYLDRSLAPLVEKGASSLTEVEEKLAARIARNPISLFMMEVGDEVDTYELQDYVTSRHFKQIIAAYLSCRAAAATHRLRGEIEKASSLEEKAAREMVRLKALDPFSDADGRTEQALKDMLVQFVADAFYHKGEE